MRSPVDVIKGRVVSYDPVTGNVIIKANYPDWQMFEKRKYHDCLIQMVDGRPISDKQRKACYKLIGLIADWVGDTVDSAKEDLKAKFLREEIQSDTMETFSLSNAPVSLVCAFQKFLVRMVIDYGIPTSFPLLDYVDDVSDYIYSCTARKRCCICGKKAELHHHKRIGMGRNRAQIDQTDLPVEPLCRKHHTECHTMLQSEFDEKYHIKPVTLDENLMRAWGINGKRIRFDQMNDPITKEI